MNQHTCAVELIRQERDKLARGLHLMYDEAINLDHQMQEAQNRIKWIIKEQASLSADIQNQRNLIGKMDSSMAVLESDAATGQSE
jgi:predicted  nucleic acid-binding Zn-ribbon protein